MSTRPTPDTDKCWEANQIDSSCENGDPWALCASMERQRDDARDENKQLRAIFPNILQAIGNGLNWRETPPDAIGWWVAWDRYSVTLLDIKDDDDGNLVAYICGRNKRVGDIGWALCWMPVPIPESFVIHLPNTQGEAQSPNKNP